MRRPRILLLALLGLAACAGGQPSRPNVLLVSIDSLRADHVGINGYARDTTPHLDALGRAGVVFRQAISPASWTLPSHVTLLTALPTAAHGVGAVDRRLSSKARTLAEVLQHAGYDTAAFVAGPLLRRMYGHDQGFDHYDESAIPRPANRGTTSEALVGLVEAWLASRPTEDDDPFFLFLHMWDVHYDYEPAAPWDRVFDASYAGDLDAGDYERNPDVHPNMDARDLEHLIALYDGEIRQTDHWIGQLLARLDALGMAGDTLVVVTADHGDAFFEHGLKGHGKTVFDEVIRVPLLMRFPGRIAPGQVRDEQVRLSDVAPTVLGLLGVTPPPDFGVQAGPPGARGVDLAPWLAGTPARPFPRLPAYGLLTNIGPRHLTRFVRTPERKLIETGAKAARRAYDLALDPAEQTAVADAPRLGPALDRWRRFWAARGPDLSEPVRLDPAVLERLRELGYID